ncbi:MAG: SpoIID/LytB domain-containing protein [Nocardioidaceae bacterium]|nr:SpoIID/LytB domain-containing protein [Nocardioidaceae bacterium]
MTLIPSHRRRTLRRSRPLRWRRAGAIAVVAALATTGLSATAVADRTYYVPITKSWTIHGHGYGHGHGMSQYGAYGAALRGRTYTQIMDFYYPGTSWARVRGMVRVLISGDWTSDLQVRARPGLTVRDLRDGTRWRLPKRDGLTAWRLTPVADGSTAVQFRNSNGWHRWRIPGGRETFRSDGQFKAPGPLTLLLPSGEGKRYRGALRLKRPYVGASSRDTVNVLRMDSYVQGVVPYEMPASWAQQALRSQAVAARTYAAWQRAQNPDRYYQVCDTTACQVYGGVAAEQTSTNDAVQGTARRILTYGGRPAFTQFSASSGGWTSAGGVPYLPAQKDPYDDFPGNGVHDWTATVSAASLESAYPEIGRLVDLRVTARDGNGQWNGRVLQIVLDGTDGTAQMTGDDFRWHYGLRSNWFTIEATPIIQRWRAVGGRSNLGPARSGEYAVHTGSAQTFDGGRVFWSSRSGARELRGSVLKAYRAWGGPDSSLGWPATGMMDAAGNGRKARFQHGKIYNSRASGAHVVYGPIMQRWSKAGAAGGWLGYPVSNVFAIDGGLRARFQHGRISWDRSSDRFRIRRR